MFLNSVEKKCISIITIFAILVTLALTSAAMPRLAFASDARDNVIEKLADKLMEIRGKLDASDVEKIKQARSEIKNKEDEIGEVVRDFHNKLESDNRPGEEALVNLVIDLGKIYYTTDKEELKNRLDDFIIRHRETIKTILGDDITVEKCYEFALAVQDEIPKVLKDEIVKALLEGKSYDEMVAGMTDEVLEKAINNVLGTQDFKEFDNRLINAGITVKDLMNLRSDLLNIVDPDREAEKALVKGFIRTQAKVYIGESEITEDTITVGSTRTYTLEVLGYNVTRFLNWTTSNENIASIIDKGELEAKTTGEVIVTVYKDCPDTEWIKKFDVTVTAPATGGGGGGGAAPAPEDEDEKVEVIDEKEVEEAIEEAEKTDKIVLKVEEKEAIAIEKELFEKIEKTAEDAAKPVEIVLEKVKMVIPPVVIDQIAEVLADIEDAEQVKIVAEPLPEEKAKEIVKEAVNAERYSLVGEVIEINIAVITKDDEVEYVKTFDGKIEITLPVTDSNAQRLGEQGLLTVCRYDENKKMWQDKRGKYNKTDKTITFTTDRFSKFAVMKRETVTFDDIVGHWAQKDIERMATVGMVVGVGDDKFDPDRNITRSEFTALIVRLLDLEEDSTASNFKDVDPTAWYAGAIGAAVKAGLVAGFEDGTFRPNEIITREQMAAMIIRVLEKSKDKPDVVADVDTVLAQFEDKENISKWAREVVAQAVNEGIMVGRAEGRFAPKGNTTRAEATVVINRIYDRF